MSGEEWAAWDARLRHAIASRVAWARSRGFDERDYSVGLDGDLGPRLFHGPVDACRRKAWRDIQGAA